MKIRHFTHAILFLCCCCCFRAVIILFHMCCSHCDSFEDASMLLEQLRSFDNHVYGITHGLLNGSSEVWKAAKVLFDDLKRLDSSTAAAFYNALTDMLWHFGQVHIHLLVMLN